MLASIVIGNQQKEATIDTGASRSYVSESVAEQLRGCSVVIPVENKISLANGATVEVREFLGVEVRLGGKSCNLEVGVMPSMLDDVLLGLDFLRAADVEMQCGDQKVKFSPVTHQVMVAVEEEVVEATSESKPSEEDVIRKFLEEELDKFKHVKGPTNLAEHKIVLKDDRPVRQRYTQRNPEMQRLINEEIDELLKNGCIEHTVHQSLWHPRKMGN